MNGAAKLSGLLDDMRAALGPDGSRLSNLLGSAEGSLDSADEAFSILNSNRNELEATLWDLRDTAANLKSFSQQVKERPFSLIRKSSEPDRRPGQGVKGSTP